jgi:hypothetical protein
MFGRGKSSISELGEIVPLQRPPQEIERSDGDNDLGFLADFLRDLRALCG